MLLLGLLLGCTDHIINEIKQPSIIVAPDTLDFGHLLSGHETDTMTVTISNGGTADLVIDHLEIVGDNYTADLNGFVVPSEGWHQIEVSYDPKTFEHNEGYLDIYLEGDEQPSEGVWLNGHGDAPVINVTPSEVDFGAPLLGCDTTTEIIVQNDGNVDLIVTDMDIMATVPPDITIDLGTLPPFPWTIAPSGRVAFFSNYVPLDEDDDETTFDIHSSDPLTPTYAGRAVGAAVLSNETIQTWIQKEKIIVDIVWIIDNSGSMWPYQNLLGNNMDIFMQMFMAYSPDFQMAFITTDSPFFVNGHVIDSRRSADPLGEAVHIISSIGHMGSGWEQGLNMFMQCIDGGECTSIMRPDATLVGIFMSDEQNWGVITETEVISAVDRIKPGMFVPYAIIGDMPSGCFTHPLNAQPGYGYYDLVQHYNSHWWSICDNDWGTQLEEMAQNISIQTAFPLDSEDPHIDTIRVSVNGQMIGSGWEYNEDHNAVIFDLEDAPEPGDTIEIGYSTWGCGEE